MTELFVDEIASPIGGIVIVASDKGLCALEFADQRERTANRLRTRFGSVSLVKRRDPLGCTSALRAYLSGRPDALERVAVDTAGTAFERAVWSELCRIPFGSTATYGELARRIGRPGAARAVGTAAGHNPAAIVVPCHRLIATEGLGGYACGLWRKQWLLDHERGCAAALEAASA